MFGIQMMSESLLFSVVRLLPPSLPCALLF
jgi:hypothetical protein